MVSYGDNEFREWAEGLNLNDEDLSLLRKTVNRHKHIWFLIYLLGCSSGLATMMPDPFASIFLIVSEICALGLFVALPFFLESWMFARILKYGTFNVRPNLIWSLLYICLLISCIAIFPLIIWKLTKKNLWGTGYNSLVKKGLIGNH